MDGWAAKTVKECDLKPPLISESSRKVGPSKNDDEFRVASFQFSITVSWAFLCTFTQRTCFQKRLLNTIGVSRGFGDHHLFTVDDHLPIKPFLSSVPEVSVCHLKKFPPYKEAYILSSSRQPFDMHSTT